MNRKITLQLAVTPTLLSVVLSRSMGQQQCVQVWDIGRQTIILETQLEAAYRDNWFTDICGSLVIFSSSGGRILTFDSGTNQQTHSKLQFQPQFKRRGILLEEIQSIISNGSVWLVIKAVSKLEIWTQTGQVTNTSIFPTRCSFLGKYIACTFSSNSLGVYDPATDAVLCSVKREIGFIRLVTIDSCTLLTNNAAHTVQLWRFNEDNLTLQLMFSSASDWSLEATGCHIEGVKGLSAQQREMLIQHGAIL